MFGKYLKARKQLKKAQKNIKKTKQQIKDVQALNRYKRTGQAKNMSSMQPIYRAVDRINQKGGKRVDVSPFR